MNKLVLITQKNVALNQKGGGHVNPEEKHEYLVRSCLTATEKPPSNGIMNWKKDEDKKLKICPQCGSRELYHWTCVMRSGQHSDCLNCGGTFTDCRKSFYDNWEHYVGWEHYERTTLRNIFRRAWRLVRSVKLFFRHFFTS